MFVDEHNRHKRLKVMRACEGCRRRKIKCDAATTNAWPCSACGRLKLHCVPPTVIDQDFTGTEQTFEPQDTSSYHIANASDVSTIQNQRQPAGYENKTSYGQFQNSRQVYPSALAPYSATAQFYTSDTQQRAYDGPYPPTIPTAVDATDSSQAFYASHMVPIARTASDTSEHGSSTAEGLSEHLGELKIDENGIAPYLRRQNKNIAEPAGPVRDKEIELPPLETRYGSQIRIPPALMPSEEDAAHFFKIFFSEVHPYVPVVNRNRFYHQWQYDRNSISPLLLEAMLACAGRLSEDPSQGAQWLALANKHEDSFLDTPRLSTIQALLLLLKAREAAPKRGYYYRSWMTCKMIASMAKDLDLHEHFDIHKAGKCCGSAAAECLTKTRVWQTLMVCEMMIGGPQGRYDYDVDIETVDISPEPPCSNVDSFEATSSRQFAYFVRNARNIRTIVDTYHELRKTKDWGGHPRFVANNQAFDRWLDELPQDLQLALPSDGSPPWMQSHFIGNMHSHYQLGRIMLQRPQLMASKSFAADSTWKQHMTSCYTSAKTLCRLQEAILGQFGLNGLLCMQRGINFTIYAVLTCIMLHLVAITSPDPDLYSDAREYFTRHMRILEECINAWPMQEMRAQIDALREAFSADKDKPFELKMSFPYGTPSDSYQPSPPREQQYPGLELSDQEPYSHQGSQPYPSQTMTPPISAVSRESGFESPHPQTNRDIGPTSSDPSHSMTHYTQPYPQHSIPSVDEAQWNPTPIFHQWNAAFSIPQAALAPPPPPSATSTTPPMSAPVVPQQPNTPISPSASNPYIAQYATGTGASFTSAPRQQPAQQAPQPQTAGYTDTFVSSKQWQQSVASVFDPDGLKRRWAYSELDDPPQKRIR